MGPHEVRSVCPETVYESTSPAKKRIDVTPASLDDYKARLMKEVEDNEKERRKSRKLLLKVFGIQFGIIFLKKLYNSLVLERAEERQTRGPCPVKDHDINIKYDICLKIWSF